MLHKNTYPGMKVGKTREETKEGMKIYKEILYLSVLNYYVEEKKGTVPLDGIPVPII
jgi:hypothetical protein